MKSTEVISPILLDRDKRCRERRWRMAKTHSWHIICCFIALLAGAAVVLLLSHDPVYEGPVPGLRAFIVIHPCLRKRPSASMVAYDCSNGDTIHLANTSFQNVRRHLSTEDRWGAMECCEMAGHPRWSTGRLVLDQYSMGHLSGTVTIRGRIDRMYRDDTQRSSVSPNGRCAVVLSETRWHLCVFDSSGRQLRDLGPGAYPRFNASGRLLLFMEARPSSSATEDSPRLTGWLDVVDLKTGHIRSIKTGDKVDCDFAPDTGFLIGSEEVNEGFATLLMRHPECRLYIIDISHRTPKWHRLPLWVSSSESWTVVRQVPKFLIRSTEHRK